MQQGTAGSSEMHECLGRLCAPPCAPVVRELSSCLCVAALVPSISAFVCARQTNNPRKIAVLEELGVTVTERIPCLVQAQAHSVGYLTTKQARARPDGVPPTLRGCKARAVLPARRAHTVRVWRAHPRACHHWARVRDRRPLIQMDATRLWSACEQHVVQ